ncbi:hypothetical protein T01_9478, partial [Trichinella spiralis]
MAHDRLAHRWLSDFGMPSIAHAYEFDIRGNPSVKYTQAYVRIEFGKYQLSSKFFRLTREQPSIIVNEPFEEVNQKMKRSKYLSIAVGALKLFRIIRTFTLIDENVMQSFIGNCPIIVELMASKCGDLPVEYNSSPLHYLIDSVEESSCKFLF